jgi:Tfp pilus assembly protein PilV
MRRAPAPTPSRPRRGSALLDGLIALAILAFGMLAMTRFQGRLVAQATDAQLRQTASELASELVSTVLVDGANAACYTLPQAGACTNADAKTRTESWKARVTGTLPGAADPTSTLDAATGRLTIVLGWTDKGASDARTLTTVTDVR